MTVCMLYKFNCAYSCGVQRSTLMSSSICSILFFLKIGFPLNMVPTDFSYSGWPASPRHLPVCLPGDGITGGTQLFCVRWVNLPRLETHTLVRLAALQLWAVWPTLHWCLILQSVWQAGTDSLRWRKHSSQTVFEPWVLCILSEWSLVREFISFGLGNRAQQEYPLQRVAVEQCLAGEATTYPSYAWEDRDPSQPLLINIAQSSHWIAGKGHTSGFGEVRGAILSPAAAHQSQAFDYPVLLSLLQLQMLSLEALLEGENGLGRLWLMTAILGSNPITLGIISGV